MSYDATLRLRRWFRWAPRAVDTIGEQALFYGETMRYVPNALTRYRKETVRLIAEMTMGTGALVMIGGTVGVAAFLTLASGGVIAVQGYSSLGNIGIEALTGFLSAFLNVRIVAPVIAGIALAAHRRRHHRPTWRHARRRGDRRGRIDGGALDVLLGVHQADRRPDRNYPALFAVGAGGVLRCALHDGIHQQPVFRPVRPLLQYVPGTDRSAVVVPAGHRDVDRGDAGAYLLRLQRIGGPVGVGIAVGQAVRTSLIVVVTITLFISPAAYGASGNFNLSG